MKCIGTSEFCPRRFASQSETAGAKLAKEFMIANNKKKIELAITGIGIVFLIFMAISHMPNHKNNKPISGSEPFSSPESAMAFFTNDERQTTNDEKWGRDPFLLDASSVREQGMEELELNGIVSDKQSPYAIINNDVVKLGDQVNGMIVIEINEKNVVLDENGQKHTMELNVY